MKKPKIAVLDNPLARGTPRALLRYAQGAPKGTSSLRSGRVERAERMYQEAEEGYGLTKSETFSDNVLYWLLEEPRE